MRIQTEITVIFDFPQDEEKEKEFLQKNVNPFSKFQGYVWGFSEGEYNGQKQRLYKRTDIYHC
jgi:hypothetical protein